MSQRIEPDDLKKALSFMMEIVEKATRRHHHEGVYQAGQKLITEITRAQNEQAAPLDIDAFFAKKKAEIHMEMSSGNVTAAHAERLAAVEGLQSAFNSVIQIASLSRAAGKDVLNGDISGR